MVPDPPRLVDHAWEQHAADASAPLAALDVDRQVGDVVIGRPRIEAVETGPGDDAPVALGHEHRMALAPCRQPLPPLIRRPELRLEGRDAILDALVVDRRDRRNITLARRPHHDRGHAIRVRQAGGIVQSLVRMQTIGDPVRVRFAQRGARANGEAGANGLDRNGAGSASTPRTFLVRTSTRNGLGRIGTPGSSPICWFWISTRLNPVM